MAKKTNNRKSKSVLEVNKCYVGNCLDVLKTFPDESLDMCITSPPYWGLRDYGTEGQIWGGDDKCKHDFDKSKRKLHSGSWGEKDSALPHFKNATVLNWEVEDALCNKCGAWNGQLGLEPTPDMFVDHLCDIFDEVKRVLKPTGNCWVNLGDTYANTGSGKGTGNMQHKNKKGAMTPKVKCDLPAKCLVQIPSRFAIEMTNRGWILRNEIIWHKPSCLPSPATDRYTVDFEKMYFFTKNKKYYFKQQFEELSESFLKDKRPRVLRNKLYDNSKYVKSGMMKKDDGKNKPIGGPNMRNKRAVWSINTASFKDAHFAVYPPSLIESPIDAGCPEDGVVLDPFFGSGTTAEIAMKQGKDWVGIELNEDYEKISQKRLKPTIVEKKTREKASEFWG
jgi:site-specific DNA-methyltransferase (adenine-specific)